MAAIFKKAEPYADDAMYLPAVASTLRYRFTKR